MIKTQVQIPDHLYREAKRIAAEQEISFAEVVRRGLERMATTHPPGRMSSEEWALPRPANLGEPLASEEDWARLSH